jgi:hypothetical protein
MFDDAHRVERERCDDAHRVEREQNRKELCGPLAALPRSLQPRWRARSNEKGRGSLSVDVTTGATNWDVLELRSGSRTLKLLLRWNGCQLQRKAGTNISTDGVHEGAGGGCGKREGAQLWPVTGCWKGRLAINQQHWFRRRAAAAPPSIWLSGWREAGGVADNATHEGGGHQGQRAVVSKKAGYGESSGMSPGMSGTQVAATQSRKQNGGVLLSNTRLIM